MEVAVSMIYSIPYNGINLNWTAVTGNDGILMEFSQEEIRLHGILMEISWNYIDYFWLRFYAEYIYLKSYFMLFPSQCRSMHVQ